MPAANSTQAQSPALNQNQSDKTLAQGQSRASSTVCTTKRRMVSYLPNEDIAEEPKKTRKSPRLPLPNHSQLSLEGTHKPLSNPIQLLMAHLHKRQPELLYLH
ncbi:hypothetical protein O181_026778 [Austropuccinia psidii MF-1]|uniref:Uncharacterized protein n=1 Tax=Austropuccinia psidii MF-1 TaxID=1389203 RepID=A0A9Q3CQG7_9BASI|nr:hypothetical protein [Austropuccinia psidii MF-1]